jgi:ferredoxin--NADP+ reductase
MTEIAADSATATDAPRAVIVGAGPSGFYAADQLLGAGFEVDVLDASPSSARGRRASTSPHSCSTPASRSI